MRHLFLDLKILNTRTHYTSYFRQFAESRSRVQEKKYRSRSRFKTGRSETLLTTPLLPPTQKKSGVSTDYSNYPLEIIYAEVCTYAGMKVSTEQLDQRVPDIQDQRAVLLLLLFQLDSLLFKYRNSFHANLFILRKALKLD